MPRPCCLRHVECQPCAVYFKPAGTPLVELAEVVLGLDELEALRLADLEGLYQEQAAARMQISRPTFSRVIEQARRKVADALIHGKALRVEGGAVIVKGDEPMPGRDGTGPRSGRGMGRGPCGRGGRGQRRGLMVQDLPPAKLTEGNPQVRVEGGAVIVKGDEPMPDRDGTGPKGGRGMGRGPCGCGQRQGAPQANRGGGRPWGRRGRGLGRGAAIQELPPGNSGEGNPQA